MIEPLLTAREIADAFGFSGPAWVLRQTRKSRAEAIPCYHLPSGPVRFRASEVEDWLASRRAVGRTSRMVAS